MSLNMRNLDWIRTVKLPDIPAFGQRMYELLSDIRSGVNVLEQQGNFDLSGTPGPPSSPQELTVVPHPQGVEFAIRHEGNFYQGIQYEIDHTANGTTHSYSVGSSRNGFLPVGPTVGTYQVRALYPNGKSSAPVVYGGPQAKTVRGASVTAVAMLPGQGSGTTRQGQPPGFGGPFRSPTGAPPVKS
jgi:hypothetical protein